MVFDKRTHAVVKVLCLRPNRVPYLLNKA